MRSLTSITNLLTICGVRPSPIRQLVLKALIDTGRPMSSLEIEKALQTVDRSSITRTLVLLVDKDIVHSFEDGSGSMKYEVRARNILDPESPINNELFDLHPHFHCIKCGATICLPNINIPLIPLPDGYIGHSSTMIVKGLCKKCRI